jgi:hypothetical protein
MIMKRIRLPALAPLLTVVPLAMAQDYEARKDPTISAQREEQTARRVYRLDAPNRIDVRGFTCTGVVPQAVKLRNPLQLINPFAPLEYGRGDENLAEPMRGDKERRVSVVTIGF